MNLLRRQLALVLALVLVPVSLIQAQTVAGAPNTIDYQGKALDPTGNPLANTTPANYEMWFRIYDAQEGGAIVWAEKQIVTVSKGMFSVRLGEGVANGAEPRPNLAEAFNAKERFLGVTIVIPGQTATEILPRLAFLAAPFAYVANHSVSAERLVLNSSTSAPASSVNLSQVSHTIATATANTTLNDQSHTWKVSGGTTSTTITLPGVTTRREYYIFKSDDTAGPVTVVPPTGGTINGLTSLKLKVKGEGVVIQNADGNNWWIISDTRDKTPVGTIISSGKSNNTPPPGYLFCNGTSYSRTDVRYNELFAAIGTNWGAPDASNFRVPDLRGMFMRGVDGGRAFDDDRNSRTASNAGGATGDNVGTYQRDLQAGHNHTGSVSGTTGSNGNHNHGVGADRTGGWLDGYGQSSDRGRNTVFYTDHAGAHTHSFSASFTSASSGGAETRPENLAVNYFIKY